jgi:sporulation protein YlmC with PRC-barrel domain
MRFSLLLLSLFGILFLTACGSVHVYMYRADGMKMGEIQFESDDLSSILGKDGKIIGSVKGNDIIGSDGTKVGSVKKENDHVIILDSKDMETGSVEKGTECYGKTQRLLGRINVEIDTDAVAGACLLLLLR